MRGKIRSGQALYNEPVTLAPIYQCFVLHALDAFPGDARVIGFYERFLAQVKDEELRREAEAYLARVREAS